MTNLVDNFTRADSPTTINPPSDGLASWVVQSGPLWGISSNQGYCVSPAPSQATVVRDAAIADCVVQCTTAVTGNNLGLCSRASDDNNYILWFGNSATNAQSIYKRVAGSFTQLNTQTTTLANNDVYNCTANGSTLTFLINGAHSLTASDGFNSTATKCGLRVDASNLARFSSFSISALGGGFTAVNRRSLGARVGSRSNY